MSGAERLIPAHAGKTGTRRQSQSQGEAHPRSRGENLIAPLMTATRAGSSPLTRGKLLPHPRVQRSCRLIPAHAGKTWRDGRTSAPAWAHPRSRGENALDVDPTDVDDGSSPLTRGKHGCRDRSLVGLRLIPAHAGKTSGAVPRRAPTRAHPRSRGENQPVVQPGRLSRGSSPLTRGKHFPTCAFTAQIDQILETLELAVSSGSYSVWVACATDAPQDQVRSIGLVLPSSRGAS